MAKKRKTKRLKSTLKLILIVAMAGMLFQVIQQIRTNLTLKSQLADAKKKLQEVKDQNSQLNSEKEKLQDPDYIQSYARSNYMLSKDGEQIFYLPKKDN